MKKLINFILFQAVWFLCILGAADEYELLAVTIGLICIVINLFLTNDIKGNAKLMIQGVFIGIVVDTLLIHLGVMSFKTQYWTSISPLWMWVLWAGLMSTINVSLSWLKPRLKLSALMGAVFAPLSYWAGVRLGAGTFGEGYGEVYVSLATIGVMWAIATPLLLLIANKIDYQGSFSPE
jgi:pheromone shutdown protein TraB